MPPRTLLRRCAALVAAVVPLLAGLAVTAGPAAAVITIDGPDVSSYQHPAGASINWTKVAAAGHTFAIVKATEGTSYVNRYYRADYWGIRKAGMVRGSYHFAHPGRPLAKTAMAQASFFVSHLGAVNTDKTLPPALDLEVDGGLSRVELITWAQDFLLDVRALTGRTPMIYTYPWFWRTALGDPAAFADYPLWMAAYRGSTPDAGTTLWQYTAGAKVSGIRGSVDMSKLLADPATFNALSDGTTATAWPATPPAAPGALSARPGVGSVTVSWLPPNAGSNPITSYAVSVAPADGSAPAVTQTMGPLHMSASFTGLTPGVAYTYNVVAHSAAGAGAAATAAATVVPQFATQFAVSAPSVVSYGATAQISGVLTRTDDGTPLASVPVVFATRSAGSGTWVYRATLTTDGAGLVSTSFVPSRNTDVRLSYAGDPVSALAPSAPVATVHVRELVGAWLSSGSTAVRHAVTVSGRTTPAEAGVRVWLQQLVGGSWRSIASMRTGRYGGFRFAVAPKTRGVLTYRALVASTSLRVYGLSPNLALHVS